MFSPFRSNPFPAKRIIRMNPVPVKRSIKRNVAKGGPCCVAFGCSMRSGTNLLSKIKMFGFPSNRVRRSQWIIAVRRKNWTPLRHSRICSKHFITGARSDDPNHPDYVPSIFSYNTPAAEDVQKKKKPMKQSKKGISSKDASTSQGCVPKVLSSHTKTTASKTPATGETSTDVENSQMWTSLLNLHPISSEASTSSAPSTSKLPPQRQVIEPKKLSAAANKPGVSKPKPAFKATSILKKTRSSTSTSIPTKEENETPLDVVIKMEVEDDDYTNNEDTTSLNSSSSQFDFETDSTFTNAQTESGEVIVPTVLTVVPAEYENAESESNQKDVEEFFQDIAQTVMKLPLHLIDETKSKVSSLVYDMVIRAITEGGTDLQQQDL